MRFFLLALPLLAQQVPSLEKQQALGRGLRDEILRNSPLVENPAAQRYLSELGGRLLKEVEAPKFKYSFELIRSTDTEPKVLPGGFVLLPQRYFLKVANETELARMLAHLIGHIELEHGLRNSARGQTANPATIPLIFVGGWGGIHADPAKKMQIPSGFRETQRAQEPEADQYAAGLVKKAGFDLDNPTSGQEFKRLR